VLCAPDSLTLVQGKGKARKKEKRKKGNKSLQGLRARARFPLSPMKNTDYSLASRPAYLPEIVRLKIAIDRARERQHRCDFNGGVWLQYEGDIQAWQREIEEIRQAN
jgi:hypothetical protein